MFMIATTILDEIITRRRLSVEAQKEMISEELLSRHAGGMPPPPDFAQALRTADGTPRIIAEIKRASPSKGLIREDFRVVDLARDLAANGAAALSVLTETHYFQGSLRKLRIAADNVHIPILRKDFIIDPYQIYEARVYGASAVLLIVAALSEGEFTELKDTADDLGLAVLAEIHNEAELAMVMAHGASVIGVNSRDLKTFKTDLDTSEKLISLIPNGTVKVAESGIGGPADIKRLQNAGANAFLIGESLMRAASPGRKLRKLISAATPSEAVA
jgi:indole-3-glycerol phosphate synthase